MESGAYLNDTLDRRVIFFTGKGGVGKTSLAWATALGLRRKGRRVVVCGWNPYDDSLAAPVPLTDPDLQWAPLTTLGCFREYALGIVKFETVYNVAFDNPVLRTFLLAAPGLSETVIAGKIWDLWDHGDVDHILVDLPASGHAVSFFQSPMGVEKVFKIGVVHRNAVRISEMLRHPSVRLDLVALPEELPVTEAAELKSALGRLHAFHWGYLHLNRCTPPLPPPSTREGLSPASAAFVDEHVRRLHQEAEARNLARAVELPVREHPRFATERVSDTVHALAAGLEGAS